MKKQVLFLLLTAKMCLAQRTNAQNNIEQYVKQHAQPVAYIEPDSVNYADLEIIGKAIGNARVVMLGEQDHGDAPTFLAKTRLIKYLYEQKGFNVLAFESEFFGLNYGWEKIKNEGGKLDSFINKNVYSLWTSCDACSTLFSDFIPAVTQRPDNPFEITGFDCNIGPRAFFPAMDAELKRLRLPITEKKEYATEIYPLISNWLSYTRDTVKTDKCLQHLAQIKREMNDAQGKNEFWLLVMDNIMTFVKNERKGTYYWNKLNARDSQMAVNLKWLTEVKYAGKKIIVWAANYHVSKYSGHYADDFLNPAKTMGSFYTSAPAISNQTYILGFTSYGGSAGRLSKKTYKIPKPKANSLERWMNEDYRFAFLDFSEYNKENQGKQERFYMSGAIVGTLHESQLAEWSKVYDGIFYIKEMYPCKGIN